MSKKYKECSKCKGTRRFYNGLGVELCPKCYGIGKIKKTKKYTLDDTSEAERMTCR